MIQGMIRCLPADERQCLDLFYSHGFSLSEIAERMGLSPSATRRVYAQAIRTLQRAMGTAD